MSDDVVLSLSGPKKYIKIKSYNIRSDIFNCVSDFTAEVMIFTSKITDGELDETATSETKIIEDMMFDGIVDYEWTINGKSVQSGFLDKIETSASRNAHSYTISGRDRCQVLTDNYVLSPKTYKDKTIKEIVTDVWSTSSKISKIKNAAPTTGVVTERILTKPMELPVLNFFYTTSADKLIESNGSIKLMKSDYAQTIFEFLSDILNSAGLFMYHIPGTNDVMIHSIFDSDSPNVSWNIYGNQAEDKPYKINNVGELFYLGNNRNSNNNVISSYRTKDLTKYYSFFRIVGQAESTVPVFGSFSDETIKNNIQIETIRDKYAGINKFKIVDINTVDSSYLKNYKKLINNELLNQERAYESFRYTVQGHSENGTNPYRVNHLVDLNDTTYSYSTETKRVYSLEYKRSKEQGTTTELTLCNPSPKGMIK